MAKLKLLLTFGVVLTSTLAWAHFELREVRVLPRIVTSIDVFSLIRGTKGILYRGRHPESEDEVRQMAEGGMGAILSLQGGDWDDNPALRSVIEGWEQGETPLQRGEQRAWVERRRMKYLNLPINSLKKIDAHNAANIAQALRIMHQYEQAGGDLGALYIHCAHGADRTGLVIALYRVIYQHWDVDEAYKEWRDMGHTLVNMSTTHNLDRYFFDYLKQYADEGHDLNFSWNCRNNLIF